MNIRKMTRFLAMILFVLTLLASANGIYIEELDEDISPYRFVLLTPGDEYALAKTIYAEAGNQSREGMIAVCQVILNRALMNEVFHADGDIRKVISAPGQFTSYPYLLNLEPTEAVYEAMYACLMGEDLVLDYDVVFFSRGLQPGTQYVTTIQDHVFSKLFS